MDPNKDLQAQEKEELLKRWSEAEERIRKLDLELESAGRYQKEAQELNAENILLKGRVEKLIDDNNHKTRQIEELFRKWEASSIRLTAKENQEYLSKLESYEQKVAKLESQVQHLNSELINKNQSLLDLKIHLQEKESFLPSLRMEVERLSAERSELKNRVDRLLSDEYVQEQKSIHQRELAHFQSRVIELADLLRTEQEKYQAHIHERDGLDQKRRMEIMRLLQRLQLAKEEEVKWKERDESLQARILEAEQKIQEESQKREAAESRQRQEKESLQAEINELRASEIKKNVQIEDLLRRFEQIKSQVREKEAEIKDITQLMDSSIQELRRENRFAKDEKMAAEARSSQLADQMEALKAESKNEKMHSERLQSELENLRAVRNMESVRMEKVILEKSENEREVAALRIQVEELEKSVAFERELCESIQAKAAERISSVLSQTVALQQSQKLQMEKEEPALPDTLPPSAPSTAQRVIVAENNIETAELMEKALKEEGFEVSLVQNSKELLRQVQEQPPDLIVLNLAMGPMDGYTISCELSKKPQTREIPIVVLASNSAANEIFKGEPETAVKSFLYKPFSVKEFTSMVKFILISKKAA